MNQTTGSTDLARAFDVLRKTALKVKEDRDVFRDALHKIAFEPFGKADASPRQVLELISQFAREILGRQ